MMSKNWQSYDEVKVLSLSFADALTYDMMESDSVNDLQPCYPYRLLPFSAIPS